MLETFSYFSKKIRYNISGKLSPLEPICMKSQILSSGKNKKNVTNLLSAEFARSQLNAKWQQYLCPCKTEKTRKQHGEIGN